MENVVLAVLSALQGEILHKLSTNGGPMLASQIARSRFDKAPQPNEQQVHVALKDLEKCGFAFSDNAGQWVETRAGGQHAAIHQHLYVQDLADREPRDAPATALVCVDEDELDEWWDDQDVEIKAEVFMRWALGDRESYVHIPETVRVPIRGTVGETPERWAEICERHRVAPIADATGDPFGRSPDAPQEIDLLCPACGERGGEWEWSERIWRPGDVLQKNERVTHSVSGDGPYVYRHLCAPTAKEAR